MEENWKEQFTYKLKKETSLLNSNGRNTEINETLRDNYYAKLEKINVSTFISAYKPYNKFSGAIITMAMYLWEYEARFGFCINALCFILVLNGHDLFYRKENQRNVRIRVTSFEELESILISEKCKYLVKNGFNEFDKKNNRMEKFRNMRNNVAHYKLLINNKGLITIYNEETKNWQKIPLLKVQSELMNLSTDILQVLWSLI
ncbi:MAG: hypothetical protein ABSG33_01230 [Candidatus Bathyarchaeia archaeon]|jgi:hypothetical protein